MLTFKRFTRYSINDAMCCTLTSVGVSSRLVSHELMGKDQTGSHLRPGKPAKQTSDLGCRSSQHPIADSYVHLLSQ